MKQQVTYYNDELNDEFSTAVITPKEINGDYKYIFRTLEEMKQTRLLQKARELIKTKNLCISIQ